MHTVVITIMCETIIFKGQTTRKINTDWQPSWANTTKYTQAHLSEEK